MSTLITASNPGLITPSEEEATSPSTERYQTVFFPLNSDKITNKENFV